MGILNTIFQIFLTQDFNKITENKSNKKKVIEFYKLLGFIFSFATQI